MGALALSTPVLVHYMPELLMVIDFGGLELAVGFVLLYFKPLLTKYLQLLNFAKITHQILKNSIANSLLMKPRYYLYHQALSVCLLLISGSMVLSLSIFMPAIYMGGLNY